MPKPKQIGQTSLKIVREYFPQVKTVVDANTDHIIEVTAVDTANSIALDHRHCAYARACTRTLSADGALVGTKTAYVIKGRKATRFKLLESVAREIVSFDRKAGFAVGTYQLKAPKPTERLDAVRPPRNHSAETPTGRKIKRFHHVTAGIRSILGQGHTPEAELTNPASKK